MTSTENASTVWGHEVAVLGIPVPIRAQGPECEELTGRWLGQTSGGEARTWGRKRLSRERVNQRWGFCVWTGSWTAVAKAEEGHGLATAPGLCGYMLGFGCGMSCVRTERKRREQRSDRGNLEQWGLGKRAAGVQGGPRVATFTGMNGDHSNNNRGRPEDFL